MGGHLEVWLAKKLDCPQLFFICKGCESLSCHLSCQNLENNFHLPFSLEASHQLVLLEEKLLTLQPFGQLQDQWYYIWGPFFTSKQAYRLLKSCLRSGRAAAVVSISFCSGCWSWMPSYSCVLCIGDVEETVDHLFFWLSIQCLMLEVDECFLEHVYSNFGPTLAEQKYLWAADFFGVNCYLLRASGQRAMVLFFIERFCSCGVGSLNLGRNFLLLFLDASS